MESMKSPVHTKRQRQNQLSSNKEQVSNHASKSLLNQQIAKHYIEQTRLSQPPKVTQNARNNEDPTRNTLQNKSKHLTQMTSNTSHHSSRQLPKYRVDTDDNLRHHLLPMPHTTVFDKKRSQMSTRHKKSPDPHFKTNMDFKKSIDTISQMTTQSVSIAQSKHLSDGKSSNKFQKSKRSLERSSNATLPIKANYQQNASNNSASKNRQQTIINKQMQRLTKNMSTNNLSLKTTCGQGSARKKSSGSKTRRPHIEIQNDKIQSSVINLYQPAILTNGSPRVMIQLVNTSQGTSTNYSIIECSVNSNTAGASKDRKMALTEKVAPKGKKKRQTQKQPKQTSIQKDVSMLQSASIQLQLQQQQLVVQSQQTPSRYNYGTNTQSIASTFKNTSTFDAQSTPFQLKSTPGINDDVESKLAMQFDDYSSSNFRSGGGSGGLRIERQSPSHMFSFQVNSNKTNRQSIMEESKEVTAIFGNELIDLRPSIEGTAEKRKGMEIHTPVFQAYAERTPKEKEVGIGKPIHELRKEANAFEEANTRVNPKKEEIRPPQLKKVNSTANIGLRDKQKDISPLPQLNTSSQNTQSSSNLFSKIKSFLWRNDSKPEIQQPEPQLLYRCKCGSSDKPYACQRAMNWLNSDNVFQEFDYYKNKALYEDLLQLSSPSGSESQIERDITRTFPHVDSYMSTLEGQQQLSRVLNVFSKYDTSIGYVQGMNFMVGAILMHCTEEVAFWLFVSLIEDYEMRDIYQPKLPGLYKHSQVIQLLQMEHLPNLYHHFCKHHIMVEMYGSDWIFTLFSNIIPISQYHHFLDNFYQGGWSFFYKFTLSFLKSLEEDLLDCEDISEILTIVKLKHTKSLIDIRDTDQSKYSTNTQFQGRARQSSDNTRHSHSPISNNNYQSTSLKTMLNKYILGKEDKIDSESYKDDTVWEKLVELSLKQWENEFNENYILQLLASFDSEKMVFKQSFASTPKNNSPQPKSTVDKSEHKRNNSLPSNSKNMQRVEFMLEKKSGVQDKIPFAYNERGSMHKIMNGPSIEIDQVAFQARKGSQMQPQWKPQ